MFQQKKRSQHKTKHYLWFTLVELIVVIIILAILATIAFLSFSSYSKWARDWVRVSDLSSLTKSLELYKLNSWSLPTPSEPIKNVTYSWSVVFNEWVIWDSIFKLLWSISKKPTDPKFENVEYNYSLNSTRNKYQLSSLMESDSYIWYDFTPYLSIDKINAVNAIDYAIINIVWDYDSIMRYSTWWTAYTWILNSITTSDLRSWTIDLLTISGSSFLSKWTSADIPYSYKLKWITLITSWAGTEAGAGAGTGPSPTQFAFADINAAMTWTVYTWSITVSWLWSWVTSNAAIDNWTLYKNWASVGTSVAVSDWDVLQVRLMSSGDLNATFSSTLTIWTISDSFDIKTAPVAIDIYVATTWTDNWTCWSRIAPCRNINYWIGRATASQAIMVLAWSYSENVSISSKTIKLYWESSSNTSITAPSPISISNSSNSTIQWFTLNNNVANSWNGITWLTCGWLNIKDVKINLLEYAYGINLNWCSSSVMDWVKITKTSWTNWIWINLVSSSSSTVKNSEIAGTWQYWFRADDNSNGSSYINNYIKWTNTMAIDIKRTATIINNTIVWNNGWISTTYWVTAFKNNIIAYNYWVWISNYPWEITNWYNNTFYLNWTNYTNYTYNSGQWDRIRDPKFASSTPSFYRLSSISAWQDSTSTEIDSWTWTAASLGLDTLSSTTDWTADSWMADRGYHSAWSVTAIPDATKYYVSTAWSDSNPWTQASPFRSVQKAINVADNYDEIYVAAWSYSQALIKQNISWSNLSPKQWLKLYWESKANTTLTYSATWEAPINIENTPNVVVQWFTLVNNVNNSWFWVKWSACPWFNLKDSNISVGEYTYWAELNWCSSSVFDAVKVTKTSWTNWIWINLVSSPSSTVKNSEIAGTWQYWFRADSNSNSSKYINNYIKWTNTMAIDINSASTIINNTIVWNKWWISTTYWLTEFKNNIIAHNTWVWFYNYPDSVTNWYNNTFYSNATNYSNYTFNSWQWDATRDPKFTDANYRYLSSIAAWQAANSPELNTGSWTSISLWLDSKSTTTDWIADAGTVDRGCHY
ncbi:MAG: hypothetical protein ACD_2C00193G0002 [uncultured bacterium (gcode 4)]|uniref:Uncharacterized protein n=1 Tax=uncultured bacterium (gcode 4) TaxID=1234023 RepID=K2FDT0_9BACT|nr:MAG: hypothetical protein ACD_2C00193G0002 [uncultured bacterium (gcode 4)]